MKHAIDILSAYGRVALSSVFLLLALAFTVDDPEPVAFGKSERGENGTDRVVT